MSGVSIAKCWRAGDPLVKVEGSCCQKKQPCRVLQGVTRIYRANLPIIQTGSQVCVCRVRLLESYVGLCVGLCEPSARALRGEPPPSRRLCAYEDDERDAGTVLGKRRRSPSQASLDLWTGLGVRPLARMVRIGLEPCTPRDATVITHAAELVAAGTPAARST